MSTQREKFEEWWEVNRFYSSTRKGAAQQVWYFRVAEVEALRAVLRKVRKVAIERLDLEDRNAILIAADDSGSGEKE